MIIALSQPDGTVNLSLECCDRGNHKYLLLNSAGSINPNIYSDGILRKDCAVAIYLQCCKQAPTQTRLLLIFSSQGRGF